jgi:hypothetical protein
MWRSFERTVRTYGARCGRGGERESGIDLRGSKGQRPFLVVSDTPGVAVGDGQQALGVGIEGYSGCCVEMQGTHG